MALAGSEAQSKPTTGTRYLNDAREIRAALLFYRNERSKISLRFANDATSYSARLLDVTEQDLWLEDLHPLSGLSALRKGTEFSISCRAQGQFVMAERIRVHRTGEERGVPYFLAALPQTVIFQQRRREARVSLSLNVAGSDAYIELPQSSLGGPVKGEIVDISAGGCQATFAYAAPPVQVDNEELADCELTIGNQLQFRSSVCIRHQRFDDKRLKLHCGLEFTSMSITDRRRLERFVEAYAKLAVKA